MAKFIIYKSKDGFYRWRLVVGNGEKIAASEGYVTKFNARRSAERIKILAPISSIENSIFLQ